MKNYFLYIFIVLPVAAYGQQNMADSLASLFFNQLIIFPQEKIYLHADKSCYITGEKIWFRAHLVDATTHIPAPVSRYVYVELFNPVDSLITRVRINNDNDAYHGHIEIPQDIPEGDYLLRAYTKFMLNLDEHYFCTKTIRIGNPKNQKLHTDVKFTFDTDGKTNVDFKFHSSVDSEPVVPGSVQMSVNDGKKQNLKVQPDGTTGVSFKLPADASKRMLLLDVKDAAYSCREYIPVPAPDNDFDISFYPEGGNLLPGVYCRVAFKALMSDGRPANVSGVVYDQTGKEVDSIKSHYLGMGSFMVCPKEGTTYYAICTNDQQQSKRFDLPTVLKTGYTLSAGIVKDNLYMSVLQSVPEEWSDTLYLLAHTRGEVHMVEECDANRKIFQFSQKMFPSGVLHLVLFDKRLNPVSERLVFINNDDGAQVECETTPKRYTARSLVENRVVLTGEDGSPLSGSFSVSVTDDSAVPLDSTANILTHLLLTSDLRGRIENPAAYFSKEPSTATRSLDLLMLTQGWRRYDVVTLVQNKPAHPTTPLELDFRISGRVKQLLVDKPVEKSKVSIVSTQADYIDMVETDSEGRFKFNVGDPLDSTAFIVQAIPESDKRKRNLELLLDGEDFPARTLSVVVPPVKIDKQALEQYVEKAKRNDPYEEGMWTIELSEVTVKARKPLPRSVVRASYVMEEEQIKSLPKNKGMMSLLSVMPHVELVRDRKGLGVNVLYMKNPFEKLTIDDQVNTPLIFDYNRYDGCYIYDILDMIDPEKVTNIYISEIFVGMKKKSAVFNGPFDDVDGHVRPITHLVLICNNINDIFFETEKYHIKTLQPLGCREPVAFYAPKYDTPESRENATYDLRTTLHWQPDVRTDSLGIASFDFYTADAESTCTMVIEGVTTDGKIIRQESKLWKREDE